jgi:hypothetical protein
MDRTMLIIAGALFSVLFFGLVISTIQSKTAESTDRGFISVEHSLDNISLIVSWEVDRPSDGTLHYYVNGTGLEQSEHEYKMIHRIEIRNITSPVIFYVAACDLSGKCWNSENFTV